LLGDHLRVGAIGDPLVHCTHTFDLVTIVVALSLLKNNKTLKVGVKNKRLTAGWDDTYLEQVLFGQ